MTVAELIEVLSGFDPELEVVARYPHCCGRHNYAGRRVDLVNIFGATEDAWWIPRVGIERVGGMDPETKELVPWRDVVGIEGVYPDNVQYEDSETAARLMGTHRRHGQGHAERERGE